LTERIREIAGPNDLRALHRQNPARYPFLLQSTTRGGDLGRYDILFAFPGESLVASDGEFLETLDARWAAEKLEHQPGDVPFRGGWFLYLGYELAAEIEPGLDLEPDPLLPRAFAVRCPAALVFDHLTGDCTLVREKPESADMDAVCNDIASLQRHDKRPTRIIDSVTEEAPERFRNAVVQAKELIAAGDIYQANLSRQWQASLAATLESGDIYEALCEANPGPFAGIVRWQDTEIISSSPERLLQIRDGIMSTRPIAGTRPRSDDEHTDNSLSAELFAHPKERAEHVMLIDLERNDLGRVCEAGSVEVDEMMVLESYAHVHHIVSNVRGRQRSGVTPGQAIAAVFPGGTITGCPKVRCMEIIAALEQGPRGAYTGSFGYLNRDGSMDLNILIRTMVRTGDHVTLRAGAGIVADSDPGAELEETRAKAEGMLRALRR
jgi:anthranilate synthase component 1